MPTRSDAARAAPQLGRPVGANGEETRRRILTATMRCVAEVGYSKASIREIARSAEVSSAALYNYFATKSELLTAAVHEIEEVALPRLRAAGRRDGDVIDRLSAVLDESGLLMQEYPYLAAFERATLAEAVAFARPLRSSGAELEPLREIIAGVIENAHVQGGLPRGSDPVGVTDAVYALARGLTDQAATLPPRAYRSALQAAKAMIGGTLFVASSQQLRSRR
ncbi:TetR/AcrR family transcriptional regulator [Mycobacterium sp. IDR2000157661]|uniref:TetR/AcrR family transcriptional regulator n=1 Tax=Mycobacterium sp. IDR2000157661 TaxID=2867005 RepID=UPI001EEC4427|nr:TetR/AcrR family transcriptional regulator [Mycobacterium sp. IDR2000157661]ULE33702.1 TetR/AcrR family transcriptional regulator [Mycobacterium sp. IDR2000157661]